MTDPPLILTGMISAEAALYAKRRDILAIHVDQEMDHRKVEPLRRLASQQELTLTREPRAALDALADGQSHGGIVARVGERSFDTLEQLQGPFLVMLDGIEDPFNFGQAVRALWAAGCDGLIVRPRNWMSAATVVTRASAGATELIPTALADSPDQAAEHFRSRGYTIAAATDKPGSSNLFTMSWSSPTFLLIGGEKRGIKRAFLDQADLAFQIPYGRDYEPSLGTVSATSIIAFDRLRSRAQADAGKRKSGRPQRKSRD